MVELVWEGVRNVRDVGGLPLRRGGRTRELAVVRCGELDGLTGRGRRDLLATSPARIIDLRSPHELGSEPPLAAHPAFRHLPFIDPVRDVERVATAERSCSDLYLGSLRRNGAHVARACAEIAGAGPGPVIVHCKAGVDRTGMLVALLLDVAGVEHDAIVEDYVVDDGAPLDARTMRDVLAWLVPLGGAAGYLAARGLATADLDAIRGRLAPQRSCASSASDVVTGRSHTNPRHT